MLICRFIGTRPLPHSRCTVTWVWKEGFSLKNENNRGNLVKGKQTLSYFFPVKLKKKLISTSLHSLNAKPWGSERGTGRWKWQETSRKRTVQSDLPTGLRGCEVHCLGSSARRVWVWQTGHGGQTEQGAPLELCAQLFAFRFYDCTQASGNGWSMGKSLGIAVPSLVLNSGSFLAFYLLGFVLPVLILYTLPQLLNSCVSSLWLLTS